MKEASICPFLGLFFSCVILPLASLTPTGTEGLFVEQNTLLHNVARTEHSSQPLSRRGKITQYALRFRPHPLLAEEKIRRLSLRGIAVDVPEQIMQPLPVTAFQEESAPAFAAPVPDNNPPQTRDPEEDLLCIAKTFSYLRESGKGQLTKPWGQRGAGSSSVVGAPRGISWSHSDRSWVLSQAQLPVVGAARVFSFSANSALVS